MNKQHPSSIIENAFKEWRIRMIRQGNENISLNKFADYMEVSQSVLSLWLNKKQKPSRDSLQKIAPKLAEMLGSKVYDELGIASPPDPILDEIRKTYYSLPPDRRHELLPLIEKYLQEHGFRKADRE